MNPSPVDYERLRELLSAERLGSYLAAADGDLGGAFALYEWNIDASASALSLACLLYTSPIPRDRTRSRMPSSA